MFFHTFFNFYQFNTFAKNTDPRIMKTVISVWKALSLLFRIFNCRSVRNYLFKFRNRNLRTKGKICSSKQYRYQSDASDSGLVPLLLTLNIFFTSFWCSSFWLWTNAMPTELRLTTQKMKFYIKDFFSKYHQILSFCGFDHT